MRVNRHAERPPRMTDDGVSVMDGSELRPTAKLTPMTAADRIIRWTTAVAVIGVAVSTPYSISTARSATRPTPAGQPGLRRRRSPAHEPGGLRRDRQHRPRQLVPNPGGSRMPLLRMALPFGIDRSISGTVGGLSGPRTPSARAGLAQVVQLTAAATQLLIQSDTRVQNDTQAHGYGSPAAVTVRSGHTAGSGAGDARRGVVSPGDVGRESHGE